MAFRALLSPRSLAQAYKVLLLLSYRMFKRYGTWRARFFPRVIELTLTLSQT